LSLQEFNKAAANRMTNNFLISVFLVGSNVRRLIKYLSKIITNWQESLPFTKN